MVSNSVEILISAVDNYTKELQQAQKQFESFGKSLSTTGKAQAVLGKQQIETVSSFKTSTEALIAYGNVANSVDNIMSRYTNLQLRIENAEIRVLDSREALTKLTQEGKQGTEEYVNAQRRLEISQNNLARANNAVIGSYIGMSIQVLTLTSSLPAAIKGIQAMIISIKVLDGSIKATLVTLTPWIAVIGLVSFAAYELIGMNRDLDDSQKEIGGYQPTLRSEFSQTETQIDSNTEAVRSYTTSLYGIPTEAITKIKRETVEKVSGKSTEGLTTKQIEAAFAITGVNPWEQIMQTSAELGKSEGQRFSLQRMVADAETKRYSDARDAAFRLAELQVEKDELMKKAADGDRTAISEIAELKKEMKIQEAKGVAGLGEDFMGVVNLIRKELQDIEEKKKELDYTEGMLIGMTKSEAEHWANRQEGGGTGLVISEGQSSSFSTPVVSGSNRDLQGRPIKDRSGNVNVYLDGQQIGGATNSIISAGG